MKYYHLLISIICFSLKCFSQIPSLYFEKISVQNGLSHNKVNCILQDKRGFIWLGTDDGLNRFDGRNFMIFRNKPNDSTTISGNIITDLIEDKQGRIWIATSDGGMSRYDYTLAPEKQFRQYKHQPDHPTSIPINYINAVIEDPKGFLWLATSGKSVLRFDKSSESFKQIISTGTKTVLDLCIDENGIIWAGREGGGILKVDPGDLSFTEDVRYRNLYAKLPHAAVTSLFLDRDKNIWFGSWDKVLYKHNAITGKEEAFTNDKSHSFHPDDIRSFAEDKAGRLWMGGKEKGLQLLDKSANSFYHFVYDPSREGSVSDDHINCIFIDKNERVWIGTNRGVSIHNPHKQQFVQSFLDAGKKNSQTLVYDFAEDNGKILIGTSEGLFVRDANGSLMQKKLTYKNTPLHITSFLKSVDGNIYIGTNYTLFKYNNGFLQSLINTEKDSVMNRIIDSRIVSIIDDTIDGRPVILTAPYGHYLTYYDLQKSKWVSRLDSQLKIITRFNLKDHLLRKFYKTKNGHTWIASTKAGLGLFIKQSLPRTVWFENIPNNSTSIASNYVYDILEDAKGNLWVSTYGGGLHYFNTDTKQFTHISSSNTLIEGLQTDQHGNVWMISNGNLHKYDPRRKYITRYDLPDLEKSGGIREKIFKDSKGQFYVAGTNYFISFYPDSIRDQRSKPIVHLTDFSIFNNSYSHLLFNDKIKLRSRENYFTIEFAAPEFSNGEAMNYSYKLEGFDNDWVDAGGRNYVSYSNLEGGEYIFKVRGSNIPGIWHEQYASISIEVIPPFWKTIWFYSLCAIMAGLAIYIVYRYRINELLKRQAIRNKIAQDLHDNVGSTLSSISVYSQVAKIYHQQQRKDDLQNALEKISGASSEMISELNDTVWAINPRNDNMEIILQRMESLARPLLAAQNIEYHFHYDKQIVVINLDMEKRKNFYLIFKEGINNALKYSESRNLEVKIEQKGNTLCMKIIDDGKGFDIRKTSEGFKSSDAYGGGNGLKNMQMRAKQMDGSLKIETVPGHGTTLELKFPIT